MTAMLNKMRATAQKFKWLIFAVATVFFLIFPIIAKSSHIRLMTTAFIYALTALGLMLAIARSLMSNPKLLMLDEPSLGLAPVVVEDVYEKIAEIKKTGTSILLVEQNANTALSVADRGYVLVTGTMGTEGTSKELLSNDEIRSLYMGV